MEQLASLLLHSRTQAQTFHWKLKGAGAYAAHIAMGDYYDKIGDLVDGLVEAYQGQHGLIDIKPVNGIDNNADVKNIISYLDKLIAAIEKLRKDSKLQSSWLQNDIDTIVTLLYQTKYKLTYLQ